MEENTVETTETVEASTDLDALEDAVNAIVDGNASTEDNSQNAAFDAEEAFKGVQSRIAELESTNTRLTEMIGKMVTAYGAKLNESGSQGPEAFPTSVEKAFDQKSAEIPGLGDIVLGS